MNEIDKAREEAVAAAIADGLDEDYADYYAEGFDAGLAHSRSEVERLRTVLQNLVDAVNQAAKDSIGIFQMAAIHGATYTGKNYAVELEEAKAALSGGTQEEGDE